MIKKIFHIVKNLENRKDKRKKLILSIASRDVFLAQDWTRDHKKPLSIMKLKVS
jgi:hypothetical protein